MPLKTYLPVILSLSLGACAFKKDDDSQKPATPETVAQTMEQQKEAAAFDGQLTTSNVKVTFEEEETPGLYRMVIRWPEQIKKMEILINDRPQNVLLGTKIFETQVSQGKRLNLVLKAYVSIDGTSISTLPLDVQAPTDIIFNEQKVLTEDSNLSANRIYFYPHAQIYTDGYSLRLRATKLYILPSSYNGGDYVETAQIGTLHNGWIATDSHQQGNSVITIDADYAYGTMNIAMIGASGKSGRSGIELEKSMGLTFLKDSLNGQKGSNGFSQTKPCLKKPGLDLTDCDPAPVCIKQPENGKDGKPGANGLDGENGSDGGGTGTLIVNVQNQNEFSLEVTRKPGRGGLGGEPAPGHEGGDPGLPGDSPAGCNKALPGQKGAWGQAGKPGQPGRNGSYGDVHTNVKAIKVKDLSASEMY